VCNCVNSARRFLGLRWTCSRCGFGNLVSCKCCNKSIIVLTKNSLTSTVFVAWMRLADDSYETIWRSVQWFVVGIPLRFVHQEVPGRVMGWRDHTLLAVLFGVMVKSMRLLRCFFRGSNFCDGIRRNRLNTDFGIGDVQSVPQFSPESDRYLAVTRQRNYYDVYATQAPDCADMQLHSSTLCLRWMCCLWKTPISDLMFSCDISTTKMTKLLSRLRGWIIKLSNSARPCVKVITGSYHKRMEETPALNIVLAAVAMCEDSGSL